MLLHLNLIIYQFTLIFKLTTKLLLLYMHFGVLSNSKKNTTHAGMKFSWFSA